MAKLLVLAVLACYAVVSVSSSFSFFKRAQALHQRKRQDEEVKICCLPLEFTLKADVVSSSGYNRNSRESKAKIEMAYSSKESALFLSGSSDNMPTVAGVLSIAPEEVTMKVAMGSCDYLDYMKFSDNYLLKYIQGKICIPAEISNYEGVEKLGDQDVEVYNIYSFNVTTLFPEENSVRVSMKMRALRREDESCIPIQFEGTYNMGPMKSSMTLELQSLDISDSVDTAKFESAC